jgi:signal transduction histidine kinase
MISFGRSAVRRLQRVDPVRRDLALALVLWLALLVDSALSQNDGHGISPLGVIAGLAGTLPLALRTRAPVPVALFLGVATIPILATLRPVDLVSLPVIIALFTVAATGERRRSLLVASCETPLIIAIVIAFAPPGDRLPSIALNVGLALAALALGDAVRWRSAYRASVVERTERQLTEERLRIARDVHDSVAHAMTTINVQAGVAAHLLDRQPERARTALLDIRRVSGEALGDLRETLHLLRESTGAPMRPAPSLAGIDELVERVRKAGVEVSFDLRHDGQHLPATVEAAANRIVQEALTNVLRHSGACNAAVSVIVNPTTVEVDVADDGDGDPSADGAEGTDGFGLIGMRERAGSVGGRVDAGERDGGGWRVHASLPLVAA